MAHQRMPFLAGLPVFAFSSFLSNTLFSVALPLGLPTGFFFVFCVCIHLDVEACACGAFISIPFVDNRKGLFVSGFLSSLCISRVKLIKFRHEGDINLQTNVAL